MIFIDRIFRLPRIWSNQELKKFAHFFTGDVINVSAWKDEDKEGSYYRNYFINADRYMITNYKKEYRGIQGYDNEIFLDLTKKLPKNLVNKYDVVFNHTTLEHIFEVETAFNNLCLMSRDVVILVVPFLQQMHSNYGDYWRFTPLTIKRMFEDRKMKVLYSSFNDHRNSSVYLFFIASKKPSKWKKKIHNEFSYEIDRKKFIIKPSEPYVGARSIQNLIIRRFVVWAKMLKHRSFE